MFCDFIGMRNFREIIELSPDEAGKKLNRLKQEELYRLGLELEEDVELRAYLSRYEKYFKERVRKVIDGSGTPDLTAGLPLSLDRLYSREQIEKLLKHTHVIQITFGCSNGCSYCTVDAVPGVRSQMDVKQLKNLLKIFAEVNPGKKLILYYASEPHDYRGKEGADNYGYREIFEYCKHLGINVHTTTQVGNDSEWVDFVKGTDNGRISGVTSGVGTADHMKRHSGISFDDEKTTNTERKSITSENGIIFTPRAVYSNMITEVSAKYKSGEIVVPIVDIQEGTLAIGDSIVQVMKNAIAIPMAPHGGEGKRGPLSQFYTIEDSQGIKLVALDEDLRIRHIVSQDEYYKLDPRNHINGLMDLDEDQFAERVKRFLEERRSLMSKNTLINTAKMTVEGAMKVFGAVLYHGGRGAVSSDVSLGAVSYPKAIITQSKKTEGKNITGKSIIIGLTVRDEDEKVLGALMAARQKAKEEGNKLYSSRLLKSAVEKALSEENVPFNITVE